jgi:Zn-dependent peptidase ImmA (M78 family)
MAAVASPVRPAVLSWAISEDGRDLLELAEALKVNVDVLDGWVSGDSSPSRGQVSELARVLRRPRAMFFLPRPPADATLPSSFRHPPGIARTVSANVRATVRQSRFVQQAVAWARRDDMPIDMPSFSMAQTDAVTAAAAVRAWMGVSTQTQLSWKNDREALAAWRTLFEARGLLVFTIQIGKDEVRGFSAWDDRAPLVAANTTSVTVAARIYTLAHELGHLVCRRDAACLEPEENEEVLRSADVERWCEQFAAAFLMPAELIESIATKRGVGPGGADLDDVKQVMLRCRVSARAAANRLIDLGLAARSLYPAVLKTFVPKVRTDGKPISPPRPVARLRTYGPRVISTVFDALPPRDAMNVLRVDVEDARKLADQVPGLRVI